MNYSVLIGAPSRILPAPYNDLNRVLTLDPLGWWGRASRHLFASASYFTVLVQQALDHKFALKGRSAVS